MKKLLIDLDGVLADFVKGFTNVAARLFPDAIIPSMSHTNVGAWDWLVAGKFITKEQQDEVWACVMKSTVFWRSLDPLVEPRTFNRINRIRKGMEVYFVTSRLGNRPQHQSQAWLIYKGIGCPTVAVVHGGTDKGAFAKAVGITYAIEDAPHFAEPLSSVCKTYIIDRPYNQEWKGHRVKTVEEFLDIVEERNVRTDEQVVQAVGEAGEGRDDKAV